MRGRYDAARADVAQASREATYQYDATFLPLTTPRDTRSEDRRRVAPPRGGFVCPSLGPILPRRGPRPRVWCPDAGAARVAWGAADRGLPEHPRQPTEAPFRTPCRLPSPHRRPARRETCGHETPSRSEAQAAHL